MGRLQTKRRRFGSVGAVAAIVTVALGLGWSREAGTSSEQAAERGAAAATSTTAPPTTERPTTTTAPTTTLPLATTTTLPGVRLPVPADLPTDEYAPTPEHIVAQLELPTIGVSEALHQGMTLTAINRGPSHWPGTAMPGQMGNVVVGGHRTTYTQPFRDLDRLQVGDPLIFTTSEGRFTYRLTGLEVVDPAQVQIADQSVAYTATLFACHPPGSARYRLVAHFEQVDDSGQPRVHPPAQVLNAAEAIGYRT